MKAYHIHHYLQHGWLGCPRAHPSTHPRAHPAMVGLGVSEIRKLLGVSTLHNLNCKSIRQGCARGLFSRDRAETETLKPDSRPRPRPRRWQFKPRRDRDQDLQSSRPRRGRGVPTRGETEPKHYCASRRPRDRGVKTEATSHIYIIPRTEVVLKRSGEA